MKRPQGSKFVVWREILRRDALLIFLTFFSLALYSSDPSVNPGGMEKRVSFAKTPTIITIKSKPSGLPKLLQKPANHSDPEKEQTENFEKKRVKEKTALLTQLKSQRHSMEFLDRYTFTCRKSLKTATCCFTCVEKKPCIFKYNYDDTDIESYVNAKFSRNWYEEFYETEIFRKVCLFKAINIVKCMHCNQRFPAKHHVIRVLANDLTPSWEYDFHN